MTNFQDSDSAKCALEAFKKFLIVLFFFGNEQSFQNASSICICTRFTQCPHYPSFFVILFHANPKQHTAQAEGTQAHAPRPICG